LLNFPAPAVERVRSLDDLARLRASACGLVVAPHPFFPDRSCLGRALDTHARVFDAVEWSYFWTRGLNFNACAARWARAHDKAVAATSDRRDLRHRGRPLALAAARAAGAATCHAVRGGGVQPRPEPARVRERAAVLGGMLLRPRHRTPGSDLDFRYSAGST